MHRGLLLLMAVATCALYANPFGVGIGAERGVLAALPVIFIACVAAGFLAGTRRALAFVAPLNVLVVPALFFADPADARLLMLILSVIGIVGLGLGVLTAHLLGGPGAGRRTRSWRDAAGVIVVARRTLAVLGVLCGALTAIGLDPVVVSLAIDQASRPQLPVDGRSNLSRGAASITYTPQDGLREFVTDEHWSADPGDGARWELRSNFTSGQNVVSLASYVFAPELDDPGAVAAFVAGKDREHEEIAGRPVPHSERTVDGRLGYVWEHGNDLGYWHQAAWFPAPRYSVRVECIAKKQVERFKALCEEAMDSLTFAEPVAPA